LINFNLEKSKVEEFLEDVDPLIKDTYLNCRLIKVIQTKDTALSKLLVEFPFNSLQELPAKSVPYILKKASENGHVEVVFDLISNGVISAQDCSEAMRIAMKNSHDEIVKDLLSHVVLEQTTEEAILENCGVSRYCELKNDKGVVTAVNHSVAARWIREKSKAGEIKDRIIDHLQTTYICYPKKDYYPIILDLLRREIPSKKERILIIEWIVENGHLDLLRLILNLDLFCLKEREWGFNFAVERGNLEVVQLLADGGFSDYTYEEAALNAAYLGYKKIVKFIFKNHEIP